MENLYIVEQGTTIRKKNDMFLIKTTDGNVSSIPTFSIDKIYLFGNQNITSSAISLAFNNNIDILFLSLSGNLKGKLEPVLNKNINLRLSQYAILTSDSSSLTFSKIIVEGKLINQKKLLKYYGIVHENFNNYRVLIRNAASKEELLGIEGICSKYYFSFLNKITPVDFNFISRNRRPPRDIINCLLSLTYTMVLNKIICVLESYGFDTYIGFLHSIKYGRQSLALDILEEFRQGFCDHFVIKLLNRKEFNINDFTIDAIDGCRLTNSALKKYLAKFNKEYASIENSIYSQISLLKKVLLNKEEKYIPYIFNKRS